MSLSFLCESKSVKGLSLNLNIKLMWPGFHYNAVGHLFTLINQFLYFYFIADLFKGWLPIVQGRLSLVNEQIYKNKIFSLSF